MRHDGRRRAWISFVLAGVLVFQDAQPVLAAEYATFGQLISGEGAQESQRPESEYTVISVSSEADLYTLALNCQLDSWSRDKYVRLEEDIRLSEHPNLSIPSFGGIFDGGGYTIAGLELVEAGSGVGLFRYVQEGGVVRNLIVSGRAAPEGSRSQVGILAGANYGRIENCSVSGSAEGAQEIGGIAGVNGATGEIRRCTSEAFVVGDHSAGGICGSNLGTLNQCTNTGNVNTHGTDVSYSIEDITIEDIGDINSTSNMAAHMDTGGIAGYSEGKIYYCANSGTVGYQHVGYNTGGIVGRLHQGYLQNCTNTGHVLGRKDVGGIAGQMEPFLEIQYLNDKLGELDRETAVFFDLLEAAHEDISSYGSEAAALSESISSHLTNAAAAGGNLTGMTNDLWYIYNQELTGINDDLSRLNAEWRDQAEADRDKADAGESGGSQLNPTSEEQAPAPAEGQEEGGDGSAGENPSEGTGLSGEENQTGSNAAGTGAAGADASGQGNGDGNTPGEEGAGDDSAAGNGSEGTGLSGEENQTGSNAAGTGAAGAGASGQGNGDGNTLGEEGAGDDSATGDGSEGDASDIDKPDLPQTDIGSDMDLPLGSIKDDIGNLGSRVDMESYLAALRRFGEGTSAHLANITSATGDRTGGIHDNLQILNQELTAAGDELRRLSGILQQGGDTASADVDALMAQAKVVRNCINELRDDLFRYEGITTADLSDEASADNPENPGAEAGSQEEAYYDTASFQQGKITLCLNQGAVEADSNVGGIVGLIATEFDFDPEDDITLSGEESFRIEQSVKAVVRESRNAGEITGKKDCVGGIVGKADFGAVISCESYGAVSSTGGSYVGGIAGTSDYCVRSCYVMGPVSGKNNVGGIVGRGCDIFYSYAYPEISCSGERAGSIAGWLLEEGILYGNYYVQGEVPGVDSIGYEAGAAPLAYEELCGREGVPAAFSTFTVRFQADGQELASFQCAYGEAIDRTLIPQVPEKEGYYGVWPEFDYDCVTGNRVLEARYEKWLTSLASSEKDDSGRSVVLIQGEFLPEMELALEQGQDGGTRLSILSEEEDGSVVESCQGQVLVRVLCEDVEQASVELLTQSGYSPVSGSAVGSYLEFTMEMPGTYRVTVEEADSRTTAIAIAAVGLAAAAVLILALWKKRRGRKSDKA